MNYKLMKELTSRPLAEFNVRYLDHFLAVRRQKIQASPRHQVVLPSLTVCSEEPGSSESGPRNGLIDSDSDED